MKKILMNSFFTVALLAGGASIASAATPWNTTGDYVIAFDYLGTDYNHDLSLTQANDGSLTGNGGHPAGGPHVYTWVITSGSVTDNTIDFYADYTASADAVTPLTTMHVVGTINEDGTMEGTWSDNYQGGNRSGTWSSISGTADNIYNSPATSKDQCKDNGWKLFTNPAYKNQGQCVSATVNQSKNR